MSRTHLRYAYLATLADWSEIERLLRSSSAGDAEGLKKDMDILIDTRLTELNDEQWAAIRRFADKDAEEEIGKIKKDADRYRWLCNNNFDQPIAQVHTWIHTLEPHSQTGEPAEWKARVRGGALDRVIDDAMKSSPSDVWR